MYPVNILHIAYIYFGKAVPLHLCCKSPACSAGLSLLLICVLIFQGEDKNHWITMEIAIFCSSPPYLLTGFCVAPATSLTKCIFIADNERLCSQRQSAVPVQNLALYPQTPPHIRDFLFVVVVIIEIRGEGDTPIKKKFLTMCPVSDNSGRL